MYVDVINLALTIDQNCIFMQNFVNFLQQFYPFKSIRIYSDVSSWLAKFGGRSACNKFQKNKLSYGNMDNTPNFNDWPSQKFGDWDKPSEKMFTNLKVCGYQILETLREVD